MGLFYKETPAMVGVILGETSSSLVKNLPSKSSIQKKLVAPSFFLSGVQ